MSNNPKVTIGIPTYNSENYLRASLDSIASQTYKDIEVIISDNLSTDRTCEIAREYVEKYGWTLNVNEENIGAAGNFNKLIELSRGEFVAIYHADDIYEPTIVEESIARFESDPEIGLVGTMSKKIDKSSHYVETFSLTRCFAKQGKSVFSFDDAMLGIMKSCQLEIFYFTPSVMVRKKAYDEVGVFDIGDSPYKSARDYEMWLRIARRYKTAIINKPLMNYRIHENQGSEKEIRQNMEIPDLYNVLEVYVNYISDASLKKYVQSKMNQIIFNKAKGNNRKRNFAKSLEMMQEADSQGLQPYFTILKLANLMKTRVPKALFRKLKCTKDRYGE